MLGIFMKNRGFLMSLKNFNHRGLKGHEGFIHQWHCIYLLDKNLQEKIENE
jgi:hypothetical protein